MAAVETKTFSGNVALSVPVDLRFRDPVGALISRVCEQLEEQRAAAPGTARQVLSAFNEAFNNLAIHGGCEAGCCELELEVSPGQLTLRIKDQGPGFDPPSTPYVDPTLGLPEELAEGGYGLHIMRAFMTEVSYVQGVRGEPNVLTMIRSLEPRQEG